MPDRRSNRKKASPDAPTAAERRAAVERALRVRGFASVDAYRDWCRENGFSTQLDKSAAEQGAEQQRLREIAHAKALASTKKVSRNPSDLIRRIHAGELAGTRGLPRSMETVRGAFLALRPELRQGLCDLLVQVARYGDLLNDERGVAGFGADGANNFASAVCALGQHAGSWVRPFEEWRPRSHNRKRQFGELARHLLARYELPGFMDSVFFEGGDDALRHQCWYVHLGAGKNIRTADLPITMTAKMAHNFQRAPADSTVNEAIRFGQVLGVGGDARLAVAVNATRLRDEFVNDEFWQTVLVFLAANPMLDAAWIGPMIDYVHAIKFAPGAQEPGFSMKGRSVAALLRRVEEWHAQLTKLTRAKKVSWAKSGLPALEWKIGEKGQHAYRHWRIVELLTAKDLFDEGAAMHHCVGTYDYSCSSGAVSIWSLRCEDAKGDWRILTIEVQNKTRRIVQARGIYNRFTDDDALRILKDWAARARLDLAPYL